MSMYDFLKDMWVSGRVTKAELDSYVAYGFITQAQEDQILATPQNQ